MAKIKKIAIFISIIVIFYTLKHTKTILILYCSSVLTFIISKMGRDVKKSYYQLHVHQPTC